MIRKIFLNFTIKDKIVASYQLNQPFNRFIKEAKIPFGRGGENWTHYIRVPNAAVYRWPTPRKTRRKCEYMTSLEHILPKITDVRYSSVGKEKGLKRKDNGRNYL